MRITKKVFHDLAIFMIGFGIAMGIIFPIFTYVVGVPEEYITTMFIIACIMAGIVVGTVNIILARTIVGSRLKQLSERMNYVNTNLKEQNDIDYDECLDKCMLPVDSEDEIGESSRAFNELVKSFLNTLNSESSIRNFTEIFTNELAIDKLSEKALTHLIDYTDSTAGMVLIDKGGEIEISASHLIKSPQEVINLEIVHKTFTNHQRTLFEFSEDIKVEAGLIDFTPKSILLEPITYKHECLGVILLASTKTYSPKTIDELNVYTHGLSLGMHNAIIHDKLEQLAILDPLTKVYNRRFGMERLKEEFGRSIRTNNPVGIIMLDIDFFKKVNDTYGHIVGDQVLIHFANLIKINLRKGDVLVRYGGEEFLAILPGASLAGLKKVSEKIRRIIEENAITHGDQQIKVTVSIGGTSIPEKDVKEVEELVAHADKNLYEAKETGRNKAIIN